MRHLSCPHCGFSKQIPAERIPPGVKRVKCPKCRQAFTLEPPEGKNEAAPSAPQATPPAAAVPPVKPELVAISCPHCKVTRNVPRDKIPARTVTLQCQQCQQQFSFDGKLHVPQPPEKPPQAVAATPDGPPAPIEEPVTSPRTHLADIPELFSRSFEIFKRRILTLIGINLLAILLAIAAYFLLGAALGSLQGLVGNNPVVMFLASLVMAGFSLLVLGAIGGAIIMAIVDEDLGVRPALALGIQRFAPFLWVFTLLAFIISGGYMLFFIPGVLFTVWFIFAQFVLAREDVRGMEALLKSRAYVSGQFWGVLGRLAVVAVASGILSAIPLLGILLALLAGPFTLIYYHEVFRDLCEIKAGVSYSASRGEKSKWLLAGAAGHVFVLLSILLAMGPVLLQGLDLLKASNFPTELQQDFSPATPSGFGGDASLTLAQQDYAPGATIRVDFTAPEGLRDNAWVGIIPSHVPHGDESRNDQHDISYKYLSGRTGGALTFTAPQAAGNYDLRMHDTDSSGSEIASVAFRVSGSSAAVAIANDGPERLELPQTSFAPGEQIELDYSGLAAPASKDWISLYKVGASSNNYGQYFYLNSQASGTLQFTAPQQPGEYEFRLFLDWPSGGYDAVAKSSTFSVGTPAEPATEQADSSLGAGDNDTTEQYPSTVHVPSVGDNPEQLMVYIYALNYRGGVRFNGDELYPIKGEQDMNYNYTGNITLNPGRNLFDIDYTALPDAWKNKLELKVYRYDWQSGAESVFAEWVLEDSGGNRQYEVIFDN